MAVIPPPQRSRPTMSWTVVLTVAPGFEGVTDAAQLNTLPAGTSVVLEVDYRPHDVDPRVAELVRSAWRSRALHLDIRGPIGPVAAWWHAITAAPQPYSSRRLQLIRGGADT